MKLHIVSFGQVAMITGNQFALEETVTDTDALQHMLEHHFPRLRELKYAIAVDRKMIRENTVLTEKTTVALLPPFSGG